MGTFQTKQRESPYQQDVEFLVFLASFLTCSILLCLSHSTAKYSSKFLKFSNKFFISSPANFIALQGRTRDFLIFERRGNQSTYVSWWMRGTNKQEMFIKASFTIRDVWYF